MTNRFHERKILPCGDTVGLQEDFAKSGSFIPRSAVEADWSRVQALPVVVVRNQSGHVLLLRRKETREDDQLHQKLVIWAGGHVRKEDSELGDPLKICAARELQEELRLRIDLDELKMLGSVYVDGSNNTSKHVAIVYEWRAKTDYVAVSLNHAEFFERHGKSLSCKFVDLESLHKESQAGELQEEWSRHILEGFLPAL